MNRLENFIDAAWRRSAASETLAVRNPATAETIAEVPLSPAEEVSAAVDAAARAFESWRRVPAGERIQPLFKLKSLLEAHLDELARSITNECGKTYSESVGELRRAIENVEVACGIPVLMQGQTSEDIAAGIDEHMVRQPLGVVAAITPFNFPAMIPFWFLPYAVATGNCFVLKPSERVPTTAQRIFQLLEACGFPPGVVQLVHGAKAAVDALLDHPAVRAISFVGSTPTGALLPSAAAAAAGKRAQCQGGAKNPVVIMPDADPEMTTKILADSAFGCAGQLLFPPPQWRSRWARQPGHRRAARRRGRPLPAAGRSAMDCATASEMGPVISAESQVRIESLIASGLSEGAGLLVDGRSRKVPGYETGYFLHPTVVKNVAPASRLAATEIFGPVLSLSRAESLDEAIAAVNARDYGNMACIFTSDGAAARQFRSEVHAGNVGINIGVAAPIASFPFSGWGESFFGDLHAQARHGVEFYTQTKVVIERWPRQWSRKF